MRREGRAEEDAGAERMDSCLGEVRGGGPPALLAEGSPRSGERGDADRHPDGSPGSWQVKSSLVRRAQGPLARCPLRVTGRADPSLGDALSPTRSPAQVESQQKRRQPRRRVPAGREEGAAATRGGRRCGVPAPAEAGARAALVYEPVTVSGPRRAREALAAKEGGRPDATTAVT